MSATMAYNWLKRRKESVKAQSDATSLESERVFSGVGKKMVCCKFRVLVTSCLERFRNVTLVTISGCYMA